MARDLIDQDMPVIDRTSATRAFTTRDQDPEGQVLWEQRISTYGLNWGILYRNLRKRVPDSVYRSGSCVTGARIIGSAVQLEVDGEDPMIADLVVFADGYSSVGRRILFPDVGMEYADYVAWRGILPEGGLTPDRPATEMAMHEGGHCVVYYVPGPAGGVTPGARCLNWVWYQVLADEMLADLLLDRNGQRQPTSLARGMARPAVVDRLRSRAAEVLRTRASEVVAQTPDPFLQVVYDVRVPSHLSGRCAIIGDAATIARPHTGSGAIKAAQEAIALADHLAGAESLDRALQSWNDEMQPRSDDLFATGRALGREMVTATPDWSSFDAGATRRWWSEASAGSYVYYADDADRD
jgi:2-polyprenyl-6-methoxyphenol hydroxylase-like FAD-dependent oxidoreductase